MSMHLLSVPPPACASSYMFLPWTWIDETANKLLPDIFRIAMIERHKDASHCSSLYFNTVASSHTIIPEVFMLCTTQVISFILPTH